MFRSRKEKITELDRILGEPRGAILYMMLVMILPYLVSRLNVFVDSIWVADLGPDAITAVSIVKPLYIIISCIGVGFGIGASASISLHLGRGDKERAEDIASTAVLSGIIISIGISVFLLFFLTPILVLMGAESVKELAAEYMFPLSTCASIIISMGIMTNLLKGEGAAKKVLISVLLGAIVNLVLDPILIFNAGLGIAGAAWATSISSLCTVILIYFWYYTGRMHLKLRIIKRPNKDCLMEIYHIGMPRTFEEFCSGAFLMSQRVIIIAVAGTMALMVHNLAFLYLDFLVVIPDALGSSILTVGSACVGQKDKVKLNKGVHFAVLLGITMSTAICVLLFVFTDQLMSFFINPKTEEYRDIIIWATKMYSLLMPLYAMTKVSSYLLQVIRKSKLSAMASLIIGFVKAFCYCLPLILCMYSVDAVVWSVLAAYSTAGVIMIGITYYQYKKFDINKVEITGRKRTPENIEIDSA